VKEYSLLWSPSCVDKFVVPLDMVGITRAKIIVPRLTTAISDDWVWEDEFGVAVSIIRRGGVLLGCLVMGMTTRTIMRVRRGRWLSLSVVRRLIGRGGG
jgi:hypothetical protein